MEQKYRMLYVKCCLAPWDTPKRAPCALCCILKACDRNRTPGWYCSFNQVRILSGSRLFILTLLGFRRGFETPKLTFDALTKREVLVRPYVIMWPGDCHSPLSAWLRCVSIRWLLNYQVAMLALVQSLDSRYSMLKATPYNLVELSTTKPLILSDWSSSTSDALKPSLIVLYCLHTFEGRLTR